MRAGPSHSTANNAPAASMRPGPFRSAADVDEPCISVTGADGARVYCSMQASPSGREHSSRFVSHRGQLTRDSINILMEQVRFWLHPSLALSAARTRLLAVVVLISAVIML